MERWRTVARYLAALGAVALVTAFIGQVLGGTHVANISMLYLAAVLAAATRLGRGPAIVAAFASFMSFNWSFVEPVHTVTVADPTDLVVLLLFLLTAVVTGQLAADQGARAQEARERQREAVVLYDVVRLMAERPLDEALHAVAERLRRELGLDAAAIEVSMGSDRPQRVAVGAEAAVELLRHPFPSVGQVLGGGRAPSAAERGEPGRWVRMLPPRPATPPEIASRMHSVPLTAGEHRRGTLVLVRAAGSPMFSRADDRLISAAGAQLAIAIERAELRHQATESEVLRRADEAKSSLLHAVSHDLRTPLSSIIAGASSLRQRDVAWSDEEREEFLAGIEDEARRLDRLVGNLLSVSRIESGTLRPAKDWHDVGALVDDVVGRLRQRMPRHAIAVEVPEGLPPAHLDYVQIDQVLTNLIENATKFAPEGTEVTVRVRSDDGGLRFEVSDRGPGVPIGAAARIFEPFERADPSRATAGTGLGLAVAKRSVEAHGGRIWMEPRPGGGSTFAFTLPVSE